MIDPTQYLPPQEGPLALIMLFVASAIEYLFPPFPGDTVTLFAAFLVTARGWSFAAVLTTATLGSGLGAMLDYGLGVLAERHGERRAFYRRHADKLQWLAERFRRHGAWFIVVNRFLPGVRALFFVAAGLAGMKPGPVLLFSLLSALLWNLTIMTVGLLLGASWPRLYGLLETYTKMLWCLLGAAALMALAWLLLRWWRSRRKAELGTLPENPGK